MQLGSVTQQELLLLLLLLLEAESMRTPDHLGLHCLSLTMRACLL